MSDNNKELISQFVMRPNPATGALLKHNVKRLEQELKDAQAALDDFNKYVEKCRHD